MKIQTLIVSMGLLAEMLIACTSPGKLAGEGKLVDEQGHGLASFGFNGNNCNGDLFNPKGSFNYVDSKNDVKIRGDLFEYGVCASAAEWQGTGIEAECAYWLAMGNQLPVNVLYANYRSANLKQPGTGQLVLFLKDNANANVLDDSDNAWMHIYSGVLSGYDQAGKVQSKLQYQACQ